MESFLLLGICFFNKKYVHLLYNKKNKIMLEEKLKKIDEYFISFNKKDEYKGLEVVFPVNWELTKFKELDDGKLIETHSQGDGRVIFIGNENVSFVELVDFVDLIAITNRENEAKELLLNSKIKELKEIFKDRDLSELEGMGFLFANKRFEVPNDDVDTTCDDMETPVKKEHNVVAENNKHSKNKKTTESMNNKNKVNK